MEKFKYTAIDLNKQKYNGIFIAQDEKDLAVQLAIFGVYFLAQIQSKISILFRPNVIQAKPPTRFLRSAWERR